VNDYRPAAQPQKKSLAALIEQMKPEMARALPKHMSAERMARIATTVLRQTPALTRCTPESFLGALLTASQLGLEPGPLGECYLVPYGQQCQFIPGYRGLVKLALQSPNVSKARARVVYENDEFDYAFGIDEHLTHKPTLGERGAVKYVYAFVKYTDGGSDFDVMSVEDVEAIRARSKSGKSGPWVTDWEAMALKTVFKRLSKWMPLSSEFATAVAHDTSVRTDITSSVSEVVPTYVDGEVVEDAGELTTGTQPTPDADVVLEAAQ
jgi:recombination protein RecT